MPVLNGAVVQVAADTAEQPGEAVALAQVRRDDRLAGGAAVADVDIGGTGCAGI